MALLTCTDLAVGYDAHAVISHLNFSVEKGDYLCIVGENGAGKSTLLRTLLHLQPQIAGEIVYGDGLRPRQISYLPQQTAAQKDFPASVCEVVLSGCLGGIGSRFFFGKKERRRVEEMLERLEIADLRDRCFRELSGGQQQRVLLARALCAEGKLLLLDEPTAGLDPRAMQTLYEVIAKLNHEGTAVILITHDMTPVRDNASHVLHIGRESVFFGTAETYKSSPLGRSFIGERGGTNGV